MILSFGFPRSGTTLVEKMFVRGEGYFYHKVAEGSVFHPMNTVDGLVDLARLFRKAHKAFIHTIRNPLDCMESLYAMGTRKPDDHDEFVSWMNRYRGEEARFKAQVREFKRKSEEVGRLAVANWEYERLGDEEYRLARFSSLAGALGLDEKNVSVWNEYIKDVWGRKPVRAGRMSQKRDRWLPESWRREAEEFFSEEPAYETAGR